jgi:hypothetical protein
VKDFPLNRPADERRPRCARRRARALEWEQAPTPPPTFNFPDGERIVVTEDAYAYTYEETHGSDAGGVKK